MLRTSLALLVLTATPAAAQEARPAECRLVSGKEQIRVHLLTIAPADQLFTSMGHTALAFSGGGLKTPEVYSWGAYNSQTEGALPKFLAGELPYYLNKKSWRSAWALAQRQDRTMVGQVLNVDPTQAAAALARIREESRPENREYVYHWELANCATRARDAIDELTEGQLRPQLQHPVNTTARQEGARHLSRQTVLSFPWRFLSSSRLDRPLTAWERTMLPEHLMREVAKATVSHDGGPAQPLAQATCVMNEGRFGFAPSRPPAQWPWMLPGLVGSALVLLASAQVDVRSRARRWTGLLAGLYGLVLATLGTLSFLLWSISSLDGVGPTENWLLAGPQTWVLVYAGEMFSRGRALSPRVQKGLIGIAVLGCLAVVINVLPFFHQVNGDIVLALLPGLLASVAALLGQPAPTPADPTPAPQAA